MRVLVCGGRDYGNLPPGCPRDSIAHYARKARGEALVFKETMDAAHVDNRFTAVIHGAYRGADAMADAWAKRMAVEPVPFKADWKGLGKGAGPIRNQRMIDEGKPDLVIAFPGGDGTADMVRRARAAGVKVREVA